MSKLILSYNIAHLLTEKEMLMWVFDTLRANQVEVYDIAGYLLITKDGKNIGKLKHTEVILPKKEKNKC